MRPATVTRTQSPRWRHRPRRWFKETWLTLKFQQTRAWLLERSPEPGEAHGGHSWDLSHQPPSERASFPGVPWAPQRGAGGSQASVRTVSSLKEGPGEAPSALAEDRPLPRRECPGPCSTARSCSVEKGSKDTKPQPPDTGVTSLGKGLFAVGLSEGS